MRRSRRSQKRPIIEENSSDEEVSETKTKQIKKRKDVTTDSSSDKEVLKPKTKEIKKTTKDGKNKEDDSSSESDIENYLQPIDKIDFSSSFFSTTNLDRQSNTWQPSSSHVSRLSDSSSPDSENNETVSAQSQKANETMEECDMKTTFQQMDEFQKKMEKTKQQIEKYNQKQKSHTHKSSNESNKIKIDPSLELDISELLTIGETKKQLNLDNIVKEDLHPSDFESSGDDWEEVKMKENQESKDITKSIPKEGIQVTVNAMPDNIKKKKKVDLLAAMKRRLNRIRKENQVYVHKVHLLCWIAHGNYVNTIINRSEILSQALSLLPSDKCYPSERTDLKYLEQIVQWYKKTVVIIDKPVPKKLDLMSCMQWQITKKQAFNIKMYVIIFIAILRALGIQTRLVLSFQVEPLRPPASELHSLANENLQSDKNTKKVHKKKGQNKNVENCNDKKHTKEKSDAQEKTVKNIQKIAKKNNARTDSKEISQRTTTRLAEKSGDKTRKSKGKPIPQMDGFNVIDDSSDDGSIYDLLPQLDGPGDRKSLTKKPSLRSISTRSQNVEQVNKSSKSTNKSSKPDPKKSKFKLEDSEDEFTVTKKTRNSVSKDLKNSPLPKAKKQIDVRDDIIKLVKGRISEQKQIDRSRLVNKKRSYIDSDSDSDYCPEPIKKKFSDDEDEYMEKTKVKRRIKVKKEGNKLKVISSDSSDPDESGKKKKKGINVWVEVFLDAEEKWISADVVKGQVHCVNEIYNRATHPVSYIVAWNNDNTLKDVTMRYCKNFSTVTRKLRVDPKWWEETLKPFIGRKTARDKEEEDDLNRQQLDQPMPKAISEYKNHPLYALRRHLLKFEAIYPDNITPLGYIRGEAVYPRNTIYTCKSRDIWLKEAKVVKPGEKPYKIVKARPKYDKLSNSMITDQMLEIFGPWQTMDYEPPTAENGIVPRNAFGNVELFKACMLPKGTVHIKLNCLNKVCKKLNVDCASAIVGFDFHGGWSHPVYDGFVVCEEFADKVIAAWELEQEEMERKASEKIEQRVYTNWKKLIKGLLIREKLKAKYDFGEPSSQSTNKNKKSKTSRSNGKKN